MKFKHKPIIIEAARWNGSNLDDISALGGATEYSQDFLGDELVIKTLEGEMIVGKGDWVVKGVKGELYPVKDAIFISIYDLIL